MWYSLDKILKKQALFNFIVGNRGGGKTYAFKEKAINNFLNKGEQFIYLRRYKTEISSSASKFFNDISEKFDNEFKVNGNTALIDGKECGYFVSLSNAKIKKSVAYPKVSMICFDEFILDNGYHHYIPDEVIAFLEFYETVARLRDVSVLFLSNAITVANPYFSYFNINTPKNGILTLYNNNGKYITINNEKSKLPSIAVEFYKNADFIEKKKSSRFGQLIQGTKYCDYAIDNEMIRDTDDFIKYKSSSKFIYSLEFENFTIGVWQDKSIFYLSKDFQKSRFNFTLVKNKVSKDCIYINKNNPIIKGLKRKFNQGLLYFEDIKIKHKFYELI